MGAIGLLPATRTGATLRGSSWYEQGGGVAGGVMTDAVRTIGAEEKVPARVWTAGSIGVPDGAVQRLRDVAAALLGCGTFDLADTAHLGSAAQQIWRTWAALAVVPD